MHVGAASMQRVETTAKDKMEQLRDRCESFEGTGGCKPLLQSLVQVEGLQTLGEARSEKQRPHSLRHGTIPPAASPPTGGSSAGGDET